MSNDFVFLINLSDNEARFLIPILEENNIPVLEKHRETGGYAEIYLGQSVFGIDLFVPDSRLEAAREIVQEYHTLETEADPAEKETSTTNLLLTGGKVIIILYLLFLLGTALYGIIVNLLH